MKPLAAAVLGVALLLGCTRGVEPAAAPSGGNGIGRIGPIVVAAPQDGSEDAEVGGTVTWSGTERDCLNPGWGDAEGVVWPAGTTWDTATSEIVLPDSSRLAVGDQFTFGGGAHDTSNPPAATQPGFGLTVSVHEAARECGWTTVLYVQSVD